MDGHHLGDAARFEAADSANAPEEGVDARLAFILAGHSHTFAMGAPRAYAGQAAAVELDGTGGSGLVVAEPWSGSGRSDRYWQTFVDAARSRTAILVYMGSQHFGSFLFNKLPLFDFVDPHEPDQPLLPGAVPVARRMVEDAMWRMGSMDHLVEMLQRLAAAGCPRIVLSGTPPVREDYATGFEHLLSVPFWRSVAEAKGVVLEEVTLTPAPVMRKLWRIVQEQLAGVAAANDAHFVPVPDCTLTAEDYLDVRFHGSIADFTHTNDEYGSVVLDHLLTRAATLPLRRAFEARLAA